MVHLGSQGKPAPPERGASGEQSEVSQRDKTKIRKEKDIYIMPASIFGERFYGRRTPAWHRIGTVMDLDATVTEAMQYIDVDFEIYTTPTFVQVNGQYVATEDLGITNNIIMREPTTDDPRHRALSAVGGEWTPIQMRDLATYLDPISERYPVETIGALGHGEKVFITLDAGDSEIAGEQHKLYYLITDHRDGMGALQIAFTPVRVVCQNTLTTGLSSAKVSVSLNHTRHIKVNTEWYTNLFNSMLDAQRAVINDLETLAEYELQKGGAETILSQAYPVASPPTKLKLSKDITEDDLPRDMWLTLLNDTKDLQDKYEQRKATTERYRAGAMQRFNAFNDEFPRNANTPYAMYQAIVETEDFRNSKGNNGSALFGLRANTKARAFKSALAMCK